MLSIAVIGAGPGGAFCSSLLARKGFRVTLFDYRAAWEKPCGGGVTYKAIERYPFLEESLHPHRSIRAIEVLSPRNQSVTFPLSSPLSIYSRSTLNRIILDRAISAGVTFLQKRVLGFARNGSVWRLRTDQGNHEVDLLIGADGVNSFVRKTLGSRFPAEDLMMTFGYRVPFEMEDRITIKFYPEFHGYLWAFPRPEHVSFGICGRLNRYSMHQLKNYLHEFMEGSLPPGVFQSKDFEIYSSLIPSLRPASLCQNKVSGEGWALVGDAAGFCDPITCEGIYFALRSGELLAEALPETVPGSYSQACSDDFMDDFIHAAKLFERFYAGRLLGSDFITRMVQTSRRSPALQSVMNAFVSGKQNYRTLRPTLLRKSPRILMELLLES